MKKKITYRMLYDKLRTSGFSESTVQHNGHTRHVFRLPREKASILDLPDRPDQEAHNMHILVVRTILDRYGLIDENAWLGV